MNDSRGILRQSAAYTASLAALTGLARTIFRAGFALNTVGSFVNGLMPFRALVAGFLMTTNFAKPGTRKTPAFLSSLWPTVAMFSMTDFTSFLPSSVFSAIFSINWDFVICVGMLSPRFRKQFRSDIENVPIYDGARAEPLPELQELLLLALGLCLGFFLRGFLSHSDLIMLSRKPRRRYSI